MFCQKCGAQLDEAGGFCSSCGRRIAPATGSPPPAKVSVVRVLVGVLLLGLILVAGWLVWSNTFGEAAAVRAAKQAISNVESACRSGNPVVIARYKVLADQAIQAVPDGEELMRLDTELNNEEILLGCQ